MQELASKATPNKKLLIGGFILIAAFVYLILSATRAESKYFLTVEEILSRQDEYLNRDIRISGVVLGETIQYNSGTGNLNFTIAHIPGDHQLIADMGGMSTVLEAAADDPTLPSLPITYHGVQPDLLRDEAQAILTGSLDEAGTFHAAELLLKCPSKYEAQAPY